MKVAGLGFRAQASVASLRSALQAAESSQRGFIATGNEIYLAPYGTAKASAEDQLEIVKRALAPYAETEPLVSRLAAAATALALETTPPIRLIA